MPITVFEWIVADVQQQISIYRSLKRIFALVSVIGLFLLIGLIIKIGLLAFWPGLVIELLFIGSALCFQKFEKQWREYFAQLPSQFIVSRRDMPCTK